MADLFFDAVERAQLSDLFDELGPGAPTLLAPWTTRDIAAHLVLRERDYLAGPGLVLPGAWARLAPNSIHRGDDQIFVNQHTYGIPAAQAPVFCLSDTDGGEMAALYLDSFERVWASTAPLS